MSTQVYVHNTTFHKMTLKQHGSQTLRWSLCGKKDFSLKIPIDANKILRYSLKHADYLVAHLWINHQGFIKVINYSKKFRLIGENVEDFSGTPPLYIENI